MSSKAIKFQVVLLIVVLMFSMFGNGIVQAANNSVANASAYLVPATLIVTKLADTSDGVCDADCSLREAMQAAQSGDTINFAVSGTITLGSSLPTISTVLTIDGVGQSVTISGANTYRVFWIDAIATASISNLSVSNGNTAGSGAGVYNASDNTTLTNVIFNLNVASNNGGGMYNTNSSPTLTNVSFYNNDANYGGGIYNTSSNPTLTDVIINNGYADTAGGGMYNHQSSPTLTNVTFYNNDAVSFGGGMGNDNNSNSILTNVTFDNNYANYGGGMFINDSAPSLTSVTFYNNDATYGAGLANIAVSDTTLTNVTFNDNTAASVGGGIENNNSTLTVINTTFSGNTADTNGGAIYNLGGTLHLTNSILANSISSNDCYNHSGDVIATNLRNLIEVNGPAGHKCGVPMLSSDPNLDVLGDHGGSTETMPPLFGSPVIDQGHAVTCNNAPVNGVDQRGVAHNDGNGDANIVCDLGAAEYQPRNLVVTILPDENNICDASCSLREAITEAVDGDTISFAIDGTITIGSSLPAIDQNIVIDGLGHSVVIDGKNSYRIFNVSDASAIVFLKNLTIFDGRAVNGGGIYNVGILFVNSSTLVDNAATGTGGGIFNIGTLIVTNSTFSANSTANIGGGLLNIGTAIVTNSTFSGNIANTNGGAIYNDGGTLQLRNSILANSPTGADCYNSSGDTIDTNVNNIVESNGIVGHKCGTPASSLDPILGPLVNNGGYTQTFALLNGSPAIDTGNDIICAASPVNGLDQRGVTRPFGSQCDIGAFELADPTFTDVPFTHPYWEEIEILYANGLTAGCSTTPLMFCPSAILDRAQSAVFMLRGNFGTGYTPPAAPWDIFADDWSSAAWAEKWAEGMYNAGMTAGCSAGPLMFCPYEQLPNVQVAVFALRLKHGNAYAPPAATGTVFADMNNAGFWGTKWAEAVYAEGLMPSCGTDVGTGKPMFCPDALVDRGFAAWIIVQAKNLTMP